MSVKGSLKMGKKFNVSNVVCKKCGLVYNYPQLDQAEIDKFYKEEYLSSQYDLKTFDDVRRRLDLKKSDKKAAVQADFFGEFLKNKKILEVGCGYGTLLSAIKSDYHPETVFGVEPGKLACQFAKEHYGLEIFEGTFDEFLSGGKNEKFDAIVLSHTFEHFRDPLRKLAQFKNILSDGGMVYVEVPDVLPAGAGLARPTDLVFEPGHFFSYSLKTLSLMLKKAGYGIIKSDCCPHIRVIATPFKIHEESSENVFVEKDFKKVIWKIRINNFKHFFLRPALRAKFRLSRLIKP